jgi:hypothetical protein
MKLRSWRRAVKLPPVDVLASHGPLLAKSSQLRNEVLAAVEQLTQYVLALEAESARLRALAERPQRGNGRGRQ